MINKIFLNKDLVSSFREGLKNRLENSNTGWVRDTLILTSTAKCLGLQKLLILSCGGGGGGVVALVVEMA